LEITTVFVKLQAHALRRGKLHQVELGEPAYVLLLRSDSEYQIGVSCSIMQAQVSEASRNIVQNTIAIWNSRRYAQGSIRQLNGPIVLSAETGDDRPLVYCPRSNVVEASQFGTLLRLEKNFFRHRHVAARDCNLRV